MTKKEKAARFEGTDGDAAASPASSPRPQPPLTPSSTSKSTTAESSTSALIICRNKHWRYISCFHGPWLQLPPEVLESLAHSNYVTPRPHPIDPAVFYDLVKIRKAVDEATNLAVRAASGLTSAALSNSLNAGNGMLGSAGVAALGLGYGGVGSTAKLSRERKHRMRELATQKLSQAYHLDEIATSVATMQSASTLEDVAQLVLQRNAADPDAKYVHFFHEKIPSRMMAQCTPLDPLNEVIAERPTDGSPLRTRALTRLFKEDYLGAARDLTEALAVCRHMMAQHRAGKDQLVLAKIIREEAEKRNSRDWKQEVKVEEEDQPSSLEPQLLFHRAGVYFTIACQHVHAALDGLQEAQEARAKALAAMNGHAGAEPPPLSPAEREAHHKRLEARKLVKTNAKRALRDYTSFLSHFDYTPGLPTKIAEEFMRRVNNAANGYKKSNSTFRQLLLESPDSPSKSNGQLSDALVLHKNPHAAGANHLNSEWPTLPPLEIHQASALFSATPPPNLPPYPSPTPTALTTPSAKPPTLDPSTAAAAFTECHEAITYHPLLTDAMHSLLLCYALMQTSPKELQRHAHNAARLARICDGYPIFLAARSPARADWVEVLRRTDNWIGLSQSWEALCRPAPLPGQGGGGAHGSQQANGEVGRADGERKKETEAQKRERQKHEAIIEALADERVVDEESFHRAVRAREKRAMEDEEEAVGKADASVDANGHATYPASSANKSASVPPQPKRWAQDEKEYPISTERAEAISRWIREAPLSMEGGKKKASAKKGRPKAKLASGVETPGLEGSVEALSVQDAGEGKERIVEEEEIDE